MNVRPAWLALLALSLLPSCAALFPRAQTLSQRLAAFPTRDLRLDGPVTIRWNAYQVPFVEASTDRDLAFGLGLVQAHLREAQLALAKRIALGRLSEVGGPFTWELDQALRIIDFPRAADAMFAAMSPESRAWLEAFRDGLNAYQASRAPVPPDYALLGLRREPWTTRDVLAIGRLAGTDINWLGYFSLIPRRGTPEWEATWQRALASGQAPGVSFPHAEWQLSALETMFAAGSRSGSNCVVVAPGRSATGAALLGSDPHLGLILPNLWVMAGGKSPSFEVVGLMPVGVPVFGLGRTRAMAWSGTNMRAAASDLFDVSKLPVEDGTQRLRTRAWFGHDVTVRTSPLGHVISDSPLFKSRPGETIALRWMGHEPSDEIGAFLAAQRATTPGEFRQAFATYGTGGQNMQFADAHGNIGQIMAVWLPKRASMVPKDLVLDPADPASEWHGHETSMTLPWTVNPPEGFLASANNPPTDALPEPVGYFFNTSERVERLQAFLRERPKVTVADLSALQRDVVSPASIGLRDGLLARIDAAGIGDEPAFVARLRGWDGAYGAGSSGAVAFETLLYYVMDDLPPRAGAKDDWAQIVHFLMSDLDAMAPEARASSLRGAIGHAAPDAAKFATWGDMHFMRVQSIYARIPVVGSRFVVEEYPTGGSRETPMKAANGLVRERHPATYGSQSRFVADMSDPDHSWFTLFGGQDGMLGSANFAAQMPLWRDGGSIQMPLTPEGRARAFPTVMTLTPR